MLSTAASSDSKTRTAVLLADYLTEVELAAALDMTVRGLRGWRCTCRLSSAGIRWSSSGLRCVGRRGGCIHVCGFALLCHPKRQVLAAKDPCTWLV